MAEPGWDQTVFDAALERYLSITKRSIPNALNKKAYFVARKAIWYTTKVMPGVVARELQTKISIRDNEESAQSGSVYNFAGRRRSTSTRVVDVPMAAVIINSRLGRQGLPGLQGRSMLQAVRVLAAVRNRSVAFLKSGWITARDTLKMAFTGAVGKGLPAEESSSVGGPKTIGFPKGSATPAHEGGNPFVVIENRAIAKHDKKDALQKYGSAALQKAFDDEANSMIEYLEEEMRKDTAAAIKALEA